MEKANTVGTLVKAGAILDALEVGPQDLNDLSVLTGQPRATCHRLASALVGLRWVDKDDSGRYTIGPRLHELSAASSGDRLRTVALPTLRRLRD
ncbi:MAG TPA: helix-turn-helix domain-containing protein, partial [Actinomycetota bacterium]|nr:helix-turn-helix domain-containing protein [Actinomycetota bacterium]